MGEVLTADQFAQRYGGGGNSPSQGLPQPGDPTSYTGPTGAGTVTPQRYDDRTLDAARMAVESGDFRGVPQILGQDPGEVNARSFADALGKNQAALTDRQRAGQQVLAMYKRLKDTLGGINDQTLSAATGPLNTAEVPEESPTFFHFHGMHLPIPGFSGPTTFDPRTNVPIKGQITTAQRAAIMNPNDQTVAANWDAQNRLQHDIHALVNAYISSANKSGLQMSDSRQENFEKAMGDFMRATNRTKQNQVLSDAGDMIHRVFGLVPPAAKLAPDGNYYVKNSAGKWQPVIPANPGPEE